MKPEKTWVYALAFLFFAGAILGGIAYAEDTAGQGTVSAKDELNMSQAMMLYKYALVPIEKHRIGMEALISYVSSTSGDTTKLTQLKDQFLSEKDSLKSAADIADYAGGRAIVDQMKQTVADFRVEIKAQVGNNTAGARSAMNTALEANSDYLDSLVTEARESRRDRNIQAFDYGNTKIQERLDTAKSNGADVSALQAKLDEIKAKRGELLDAMNSGVESCKGEGLGKCTTPEAQAYVTLRAELQTDYMQLRELAKQVGQEQRVSNAITKAREVISNSEKTLENAASRGRDVSVEQAKLTEIEGMVDSAETKYQSKDYTGATNDLKSAQAAFNALKQSALSKK